MRDFQLTPFARARVGTNPSIARYSPCGVREHRTPGRPGAQIPTLQVATVEACVPRGAKSDYGLLAVGFEMGGHHTEIVVPFSRGPERAFAASLVARTDEARVGLPEEFVAAVVAAGVEAAGWLPCGSLSVIGAVHGQIGSSPVFFGRLMKAAVAVLRFGIDDLRTEGLLREALV